MDRLKLWVEASMSGAMNDDETVSCSNSPAGQNNDRPPPVRTNTTFDDDESFTSISISLLSRYRALGLTEIETIQATLVYPRERASFLQGLCTRRSRCSENPPPTASLVQEVDAIFGKELARIVEDECGGMNQFQPCLQRQSNQEEQQAPTAPRNSSLGLTSSGSELSGSGSGSHHKKKKKKRRGFFSDHCELFRSRRVKNIDWNLTQAVEQVESLRLDDPLENSTAGKRGYEPPSYPSL